MSVEISRGGSIILDGEHNDPEIIDALVRLFADGCGRLVVDSDYRGFATELFWGWGGDDDTSRRWRHRSERLRLRMTIKGLW